MLGIYIIEARSIEFFNISSTDWGLDIGYRLSFDKLFY